MNSVAPISTPVVPKRCRPPRPRARRSCRPPASCRASTLPSLSPRRATAYWTWASAARPSGESAGLSNGLTTAPTCGACRRRRDLFDRRRVRRIGDLVPSGATKTICAPAPAAAGESRAVVQGLLRLRAGDGELVVEGAARRRAPDQGGGEQGRPDPGDVPRAAEGPPAPAGQEGRYSGAGSPMEVWCGEVAERSSSRSAVRSGRRRGRRHRRARSSADLLGITTPSWRAGRCGPAGRPVRPAGSRPGRRRRRPARQPAVQLLGVARGAAAASGCRVA